MRAEDLVFWLDALRPDTDQSNGVLCRRHADSMVLPRHWTLDDLREPVPRLFHPPNATPPTTATRRRKSAVVAGGEQLLLGSESFVAPQSTESVGGVRPRKFHRASSSWRAGPRPECPDD